jgi:hypothetical protein
MPTLRSNSPFSIRRIQEWFESFRTKKVESNILSYRPDRDGYGEYDLANQLQKGEILYVVSLPGYSQEEVNEMVQMLRNVLVSKPNSVTLLLGHKEIHLVTQGKGKPGSVILQLVKNHGFKIQPSNKDLMDKLRGESLESLYRSSTRNKHE